MEKYTNHTLIKLLSTIDKDDNNKAMSFLYQKLYTKVASYILRNSGGQDDAADIFQDGLIVLYKAVKQKKIPSDTNVQGYLFSICRNLWLKRLNRSKRQQPLTKEYDDLPEDNLPIDVLLSEEKKATIEALLTRLGENCRQLLIYYYYDRLKIKEIAKLMNMSGEQVAKNKKSACMKKLRAIIDAEPDLKELLK